LATGRGQTLVFAQTGLTGLIQDSADGRLIVGAQVVLSTDTLPREGEAVAPGLRAVTDTAGTFRLKGIRPGNYFIHVHRAGYLDRRLPLEVRADSAQVVTVRLWAPPLCLGYCPPDPQLVAEARRHQAEWTCKTDEPVAIEVTRQYWLESLTSRQPADWRALLDQAGLSRDSWSQVAASLHHVTDPAICRRAGQAYDQAFGATETHFLVFQAGPIFLVSHSPLGAGTALLDRNYRILTRFIME